MKPAYAGFFVLDLCRLRLFIHEVKIMGHAQIKEERLCIPPRGRQIEVKANPALGKDCTHGDQILNAFSIGFSHYKETIKELSKI